MPKTRPISLNFRTQPPDGLVQASSPQRKPPNWKRDARSAVDEREAPGGAANYGTTFFKIKPSGTIAPLDGCPENFP